MKSRNRIFCSGFFFIQENGWPPQAAIHFSACQKTFVEMNPLELGRGELEGAAARLEWNQMPPEALLCKDSGKRSEDFCAAARRKSNGDFCD